MLKRLDTFYPSSGTRAQLKYYHDRENSEMA